jgi:exodeoxyribonuclease VII large subunit
LTLRVLRGQLTQAQHRLTVSGERLMHSTRNLLRSRADRFAGLATRLKASNLSNAQAQRQAIARDHERVHRLAERARRAFATSTQQRSARVAHHGQLLGALSYRAVLARGFALVRDQEGHAVRLAANVKPNARLSVEFTDGRIAVTSEKDASATTKLPATEPKQATPKRVSKPVGQGNLF